MSAARIDGKVEGGGCASAFSTQRAASIWAIPQVQVDDGGFSQGEVDVW